MTSPPTSSFAFPSHVLPEFKRVEQTNDHDCVFACLAMIVHRSIAEIRDVAVTHGLMLEHGPYLVTDEMIARLSAHHGWVSTVWKEVRSTTSLPNLALILLDYDPKLEQGRFALFVRQGNPVGRDDEWVVDPAFWIPPERHIRCDLQDWELSWYIGLHEMEVSRDF